MAVRTRPVGGRALPGWVRTRQGPAPDTVHFTIVEPRAVTPEGARQCCEALARAGYRRVITNALGPADAGVLVAAGFVVCEELDLLRRSLDALAAPDGRTRDARRLRRLAALDRRAFGDQAFDAAALRDARTATPIARVRITGQRVLPTGYIITGVAGPTAYVQRLAVDPDARRQGHGRALLLDGLDWARRRGARQAMVNTHVGNVAARKLYEEQGFVAMPDGLVVLERAL